MKSILLITLTALLTISCNNNPALKKPDLSKPDSEPKIEKVNKVVLPSITDCGYQILASENEGWELVFEDDFENGYDKHWTAWKGGAYNQELQHYQPENVFVENGFLYLYGKREKVKGNTRPDDKRKRSFDFTSGRIESKETFGPQDIEGKKTIKFSARLRLVEGEGIWPAWWTYGHPWPTQGELDIVEARGHQAYQFSSCYHYGSKSSITDTKAHLNVFDYKHPEKLSDCFHVYELEWSEDNFKIIFDGEVVKVYDAASHDYIKDFWLKKQMLCLNLAIGGNFFKSVDVSKIPDESFYVIDWVKVYNK